MIVHRFTSLTLDGYKYPYAREDSWYLFGFILLYRRQRFA